MPYCTSCGAAYAAGDTVCGSCSAVLKPGEPAVAVATAPEGPLDLPAVSRLKRILAALIDLVICAAVLIALIRMPGGAFAIMKRGPIFKVMRLVPLFYMLLRDSIGGKSLGKLIIGLTAYEIERRRPANLVESIVRNWPFALLSGFYVLSMVVGLVPLLGGIVALIGEGVLAALVLVMLVQVLAGRKQRLGDKDAGTQVIEDQWLVRA